MRLSRAAQKELKDNSRLLRIWRAWHHEQLEHARAGAHGAIVGEVMEFLQHQMTPRSAPQLLELLHRHDWRSVDADTRLVILHEINNASARLRERNGLAPFSDSLLPGQRPTLFELARSTLLMD
jgi:hypothetical protein